jgi:hypothetical protein
MCSRFSYNFSAKPEETDAEPIYILDFKVPTVEYYAIKPRTKKEEETAIFVS